MNISHLTYQVHEWWQQVQVLQRRIGDASTSQGQPDSLLETAFEALATAWEELCTVTEALEQQHRELVASLWEVETARQRYQELFDFAPDGYLVTDPHGCIREANRAAGTLLNLRPDRLVGKPIAILIALSDRRKLRTQLHQLQKGKWTQEWEMSVQPRGRPAMPVAFTVAPAYDTQGGLIAFRWLFRDITARKQLEEELAHAQKMEAMGRLASGMAHELGNQLTVLSVHSQVLRHHLDDAHPLQRSTLELWKAVERATVLTTQLLTFSRKPVQQPTRLDLHAVTAKLAPTLRELLGEEIDLVISSAPDLGRVHGDVGEIEQILVNLAVNARDAMPQGGHLTVEIANLEVREYNPIRSYPGVNPGFYVYLVVRDTGTGMDAVTQSRLFEPFFTTKGSGKGTGLGLSIVYGIIRQNQGHIFVDTTLGRGTTFTILLPRV
jgi:PAS domain S-box-containing protein